MSAGRAHETRVECAVAYVFTPELGCPPAERWKIGLRGLYRSWRTWRCVFQSLISPCPFQNGEQSGVSSCDSVSVSRSSLHHYRRSTSTHSYLQFDIQWSSLGTFPCSNRSSSMWTDSFNYLFDPITIILAALLYYDYALTFPDEIKYIWKDKFRLSTVLYICCRYAMVANVLYLLAISGKLTSEVRCFIALLV